jgi:HlyD family secretion protein
LKKLLLPLVLALVAGTVIWAWIRKNAPPEIKFARVKRQTLISTLPTNGKVEPYEWEAVRAESAGLVTRVNVRNGQHIAQGAPMAELSDPEASAGIESAEARLAEAQATLKLLQSGGKSAELTEIENSLAAAHLALQAQQKESDSLRRLAEKQAATRAEAQGAADKVRQTQLTIEGLERRRAALVSKPDIEAAMARVRDAEAALQLAKQRAAQTVIRAPIEGEVYELAVRPGAYLNPGDPVANVGTLDRMRVRVYVDEPLLGRVAPGQPVTIRWEALPGRRWTGAVDQMPASIQALGSRQVGEVVCVIQNPGRDLIPGTNVDAEIRTAVVDNALVIPKEGLRHDVNGDYALALRDGAVERCNVTTGVSNITQVQITGGLKEGDAVAMPSSATLKAGDRVNPLF